MCRSKRSGKGVERRCPSHKDPAKISARNAKRRTAYASRKNGASQSIKPTTAPYTPSNVEAPANEIVELVDGSSFTRSTVRDSDGKLIRMYHGSSVEFDEFDPAFTGKGNDAWGSGFYFTPNEKTARGYGGHMKEVYLNLENPIIVDGKEDPNLSNFILTNEQMKKIVKAHPNAYLQSNTDSDEIPFLGDYAAEFWDKDDWSKEETDKMLDSLVDEYFSYGSYSSMEGLFGEDHSGAFRQAVHEQTGYDGVIVDFGDDVKHYVAWFPEQIQNLK